MKHLSGTGEDAEVTHRNCGRHRAWAQDSSVWLSVLNSFRFFICALEIKIDPIPLI